MFLSDRGTAGVTDGDARAVEDHSSDGTGVTVFPGSGVGSSVSVSLGVSVGSGVQVCGRGRGVWVAWIAVAELMGVFIWEALQAVRNRGMRRKRKCFMIMPILSDGARAMI
jgi:hypothetical protein